MPRGRHAGGVGIHFSKRDAPKPVLEVCEELQTRDIAEPNGAIIESGNVHWGNGCNELAEERLVDIMVTLERFLGCQMETVGFRDLCGCGGIS